MSSFIGLANFWIMHSLQSRFLFSFLHLQNQRRMMLLNGICFSFSGLQYKTLLTNFEFEFQDLLKNWHMNSKISFIEVKLNSLDQIEFLVANQYLCSISWHPLQKLLLLLGWWDLDCSNIFKFIFFVRFILF